MFKVVKGVRYDDGPPGRMFPEVGIYSANCTVGFSGSPTKITLSLVAKDLKTLKKHINDDLLDDSLGTEEEGVAVAGHSISIGDVRFNNMYIFNYAYNITANAKTATVSFVDWSQALDKIFVGLIGRHDSNNQFWKELDNEGSHITIHPTDVQFQVVCLECNSLYPRRLIWPDNPCYDANGNIISNTGCQPVFDSWDKIQGIHTITPTPLNQLLYARRRTDNKPVGTITRLVNTAGYNPPILDAAGNPLPPWKQPFGGQPPGFWCSKNLRKGWATAVNGGHVTIGREQFAESNCEIPKVEYRFVDLIRVMDAILGKDGHNLNNPELKGRACSSNNSKESNLIAPAAIGALVIRPGDPNSGLWSEAGDISPNWMQDSLDGGIGLELIINEGEDNEETVLITSFTSPEAGQSAVHILNPLQKNHDIGETVKVAYETQGTCYNTNYTGTLREVLTSWAGDLAFDFTIDSTRPDGRPFLHAIDLLKPAVLSPVRNAIDTSFDGSQAGLIKNYSTSKTMENTYAVEPLVKYIKPAKTIERQKRHDAYREGRTISVKDAIGDVSQAGRSYTELYISIALAKYQPEARMIWLSDQASNKVEERAWRADDFGVYREIPGGPVGHYTEDCTPTAEPYFKTAQGAGWWSHAVPGGAAANLPAPCNSFESLMGPGPFGPNCPIITGQKAKNVVFRQGWPTIKSGAFVSLGFFPIETLDTNIRRSNKMGNSMLALNEYKGKVIVKDRHGNNLPAQTDASFHIGQHQVHFGGLPLKVGDTCRGWFGDSLDALGNPLPNPGPKGGRINEWTFWCSGTNSVHPGQLIPGQHGLKHLMPGGGMPTISFPLTVNLSMIQKKESLMVYLRTQFGGATKTQLEHPIWKNPDAYEIWVGIYNKEFQENVGRYDQELAEEFMGQYGMFYEQVPQGYSYCPETKFDWDDAPHIFDHQALEMNTIPESKIYSGHSYPFKNILRVNGGNFNPDSSSISQSYSANPLAGGRPWERANTIVGQTRGKSIFDIDDNAWGTAQANVDWAFENPVVQGKVQPTFGGNLNRAILTSDLDNFMPIYAYWDGRRGMQQHMEQLFENFSEFVMRGTGAYSGYRGGVAVVPKLNAKHPPSHPDFPNKLIATGFNKKPILDVMWGHGKVHLYDWTGDLDAGNINNPKRRHLPGGDDAYMWCLEAGCLGQSDAYGRPDCGQANGFLEDCHAMFQNPALYPATWPATVKNPIGRPVGVHSLQHLQSMGTYVSMPCWKKCPGGGPAGGCIDLCAQTPGCEFVPWVQGADANQPDGLAIMESCGQGICPRNPDGTMKDQNDPGCEAVDQRCRRKSELGGICMGPGLSPEGECLVGPDGAFGNGPNRSYPRSSPLNGVNPLTPVSGTLSGDYSIVVNTPDGRQIPQKYDNPVGGYRIAEIETNPVVFKNARRRALKYFENSQPKEQCQLYCEEDVVEEVCECEEYNEPDHGFLAYKGYILQLSHLGRYVKIIYPIENTYSGYFHADIMQKTTVPKNQVVLGTPPKSPGNVMKTRITEVDATSEINAIQDQTGGYAQNLVAKTPPTPRNPDGVMRIYDLESYYGYLNFLNLPVPDASETINLRLDGTDFADLNLFLSPQNGLNSFTITMDGEGVSTDLVFSDRPPRLPKRDVLLQQIGPRVTDGMKGGASKVISPPF